jgi:hypothetical protein
MVIENGGFVKEEEKKKNYDCSKMTFILISGRFEENVVREREREREEKEWNIEIKYQDNGKIYTSTQAHTKKKSCFSGHSFIFRFGLCLIKHF